MAEVFTCITMTYLHTLTLISPSTSDGSVSDYTSDNLDVKCE